MRAISRAGLKEITKCMVVLVLTAPGASTLNAQPAAAIPGNERSSVIDSLFQKPYLDIDEWRDKPIRHRYVHGGFTGTNAKFSFYLPPKEKYQGRFFQYVTPAPSSENLAQQGGEDKLGLISSTLIEFAVANGAYLVETNEGGLSAIAGDQTIPGYRVNAASAEYSRQIAMEMYGLKRPFGYAFGGSGGSFKTISGFENTNTWDGAVPYVIGSPQAIPNVFTVRLLALRVLKDKFPSILDAVEPGGSGDMYKGLSPEEQDTLREVTRMGFPPAAWFSYKTIGPGAFPVLFGIVRMMDHSYFTDFWTKPGYLGAVPPESLKRARIQHKTTVRKIVAVGDEETRTPSGGVDTAWQRLRTKTPVGFELASIPDGYLDEAFLEVKTGDAAGKELPIGKIVGNVVFAGLSSFGGDNSSILTSIKPGDEVVIDNSDIIAVQYYHRYQPVTRDFYVWDQFRDRDGIPLFPQRPMAIGPMVTGAGSVQSGKFKGKMIVVASLMDQDALPWQADWYKSKVADVLGERLDDSFRLWYTEHAIHGDAEWQEDPAHTVPYIGVVQEALLDLSAWVEKGLQPPPSTNYKMVDGQVVVPLAAVERKGIQPVVHLTANGGDRAEIGTGQDVKFSAVIEVPPGAGKVVKAEWDFEGAKTFSISQPITSANNDRQVKLTISHNFSKTGTYFSVLRATSQRDGDRQSPFTRIENLARVRVVVK